MKSRLMISDFKRDAFPFLVLLVSYTALAYVGLNWALVKGAGSPIWPAAGVGLAGLILGGVRLWPAILFGRVVAAILSGSQQPLWADALIAVGNTLGAIVPILLFGRSGTPAAILRSLSGMLRFIFLGGLLGCLISAAIGTTVLYLSSGLAAIAALTLFFNWWVGAFVGVLTIGPLILAWSERDHGFAASKWMSFLALMAATIAVSAVVFTSFESEYLRTWHILPLLIIAGLAFNVRGTSLALLFISAAAIWGTSQGLGPFVQLARAGPTQVFLLQQFVATIGLTGLILAIVTEERREKDVLAARENYLLIAEEESRSRAEELEVVLGAVPAMILVARDPDCRVMNANQFACEVLRLPDGVNNMLSSAEDSTAISHFRIIDPTGVEIKPEDMPVQRAARGEIVRDFQGRVAFQDGSSREFLGGAMPLYTATGTVRGAVGAFLDVTERKQAEDREALLAREVDHRAKNIMTVVQSILQLTKADDVTSLRNAVIGRINSLARTHSILAQSRWTGAELQQLVTDELAAYVPSIDATSGVPRVRVDGQQVKLPSATAQSIALVVHELATNAAKYGALSAPAGHVDVSWRLVEETAPNQMLHIRWVERNASAVTPPKSSGFGWKLVHTTVEHQLHGSVETQWHPAGLELNISFPINDLPQPASAEASTNSALARTDVTPDSRRQLILVLDDEPLIAMQVEQELTDAGYDVLGPALNIATALDLISKQKPDAALIDVNLNGTKSTPVAEALHTAGVPFIFCTGFTDLSDLPEHLTSTPTLNKPISPEVLRNALLSLLRQVGHREDFRA